MEQRGALKRWEDAKGFGFIEPETGGPAVFVHISAMRGERRPVAGDRVLYLAGQDSNGRWRATHVRLDAPMTLDQPAIRQKPRKPAAPARRRPAQHRSGPASLAVLLLGLALCVLPTLGSLRLFGPERPWPLAVYAAASLLTLLLYWHDKRRATADGWRTPESRLHLFELLGGWPGALVAQQLFRHKTRKASFQVVFWLIVAMHQLVWAYQLFGVPRF